MKILLLDNYDSFTFNLAQIVRELGGHELEVHRNDQISMAEIARFDRILLSPGPGLPEESGILLDVIRAYAETKPMLGVCLGHQAIAEVFGGTLFNLPHVFHGVATPVRRIADDPVLMPMGESFLAGRYHSWVVREEDFPACLEITARDDQGQIMALRHRHYNIHGVQFHPESVLTPDGYKILKAFLDL